MKSLKLIWLALIYRVRQVYFFPKIIANAVKKREQQLILNNLKAEHESERLDRICNPSKYLGK